MMEASDNQINTIDGHGPGGRVVACTKKPALRLACLVDCYDKLSDFWDAIRALNVVSREMQGRY